MTKRIVTKCNNIWSIRCSACGRCCNSPPQMSIPELFRHQNLFVGSLAIRRIKRLRLGELFGGETVDAEACKAFSELAERLLHRVEPADQARHDFLLATLGFDYPSLNRCPALGDDQWCTIHHDHKPGTCSSVPLEALVPDRLQHLVLAGRGSLGKNCIVAGERTGFTLATRQFEVVDAVLRKALAKRRADLAADKQWWGNAVFRMLQKELFADPAAVSRIQFDVFFTISPAPVLMVLADVSERCRERCIEYLDAQDMLIQEKIRKAIDRKKSADKPITEQLRSFAQAGQVLRRAMQDAPALNACRSEIAAEIEAWLGL